MANCPHCGQPMPELDDGGYFADFWRAYPHKVGKGAAARAFQSAGRKAPFDRIMKGLEQYKKLKPAAAPWCNPATWLNQERWLDQPAYVDTTQKPEPPKQDGFEIWRVRIRNYLKDGSWPQIAPSLEQCPKKVRDEFEEQLRAHKANVAKETQRRIAEANLLFGGVFEE